ncbi:MAG: hypothetical protein QNJ58_18890 [Desulfobacterales bacterium]|nr:hypothetical protein [Desulfobacterales bacterium]
MVFDVPHYWDIAIDGIQVVLCLLILAFVFRNRKNKESNASARNRPRSGSGFNEEVFIQSLKQRIDQSLANIAKAIALEQGNLDKWLSSLDRGSLPAGYPPHVSQLRRTGDGETPTITSEVSSIDQVHEQIQSLADQGMSAQQISEKLKAPLGEVELVLSLGTNAGK